jgi:hypothetical protein
VSAVEWSAAERDAVGALMCPVHAGRRESDCRRCSHLPRALDVLAPFVAAREAQAAANALREAQAAVKAERESVPTQILNRGQQAAWIIGMNRAHAILRSRADRIERGKP